KAVVIRSPLQPVDIEKDMAEILSFYRSIKGRHPKTIPDYMPDNKR
ncbi:MAG: acyltransferase, partial [Shewanella sp.]